MLLGKLSSEPVANTPKFSKHTLDFIEKASRQKRPEWLDRNREAYEQHVRGPVQHLATQVKKLLAREASDYHFPQRGLARMKRSAYGMEKYGAVFRDYVNYSASRPSGSRFDHNPNLYFMIYPGDEDGDQVLVAGGFYMPSSRQLRAVREAIARDASAFERLFASKDFAARFPGGFSLERSAKRVPKGFDPNHPRMDWIRLQGYFVWRSYTKREFYSAEFPALVASDFSQILRLNRLLDLAVQGRLPAAEPKRKAQVRGLTVQLEEVQAPRYEADF
jgi:uncharacterized protein (TIGR02453 family)